VRIDNEKIIEFMRDLESLQKRHDLFLEATTDAPLTVNNDSMNEWVEIYWEGESLTAKREPEVFSTDDQPGTERPDQG